MLKKFIQGLAFGAGFGIALVTIQLLFIYSLPKAVESGLVNLPNTIDEAPSITNPSIFLGHKGSYSGGFDIHKRKTLSLGEGFIKGTAILNNKPVEGLKVSLALNGSAMSQWATTDLNGVYHIKVPFGKYRVDGFELDTSNADKILPGKIFHPHSRTSSSTKFEVAKNQSGYGLNFRFVDPVIKIIEKFKYNISEDITLKWESYPNAKKYLVRVYEKKDADTYKRTNLLPGHTGFDVMHPELNLVKYNIILKPGLFYSFDVEALDNMGDTISISDIKHREFDFEIIDE